MLALVTTLAAEPVISEFMAVNTTVLADGDGNFPDWIEIHNPDVVAADLGGWGLRDSEQTWLFPAGISIPPGGHLVVFASGKPVSNYIDAGSNLHTTFKLSAVGESLALLRPDHSVAFEYVSVPPQREDVAYGLLMQVDTFVAPDSPARHWVPDATLTPDWTQTGYDDSAWSMGKAAVGFNTSPGPVLSGGIGFHTAYLVESGVPGNQAYGGSLGMDFEVLEEVRVTDLGVFDDDSDGLFLTIDAQLWSRSGDSGVAVLASETFTPGDPGTLEGGSRFKPLGAPLILPPGSYTMVAYGYGATEQNANQGSTSIGGLDIDTGESSLQFVGGSRYGSAGVFPATDDAGPANRYAAGTFKFSPNSATDVETDVEAVMLNINSGIVVRSSFDIANPDDINTLALEVGLDDGFVAWVNGIELARHNAPAALAWNSGSTAPENDTLAFLSSLPSGTLVPSGNVLAIQGLNLSADDGDFLVSPTLSGVTTDLSSTRFFTTPTPGQANDSSGVTGFVADLSFSIERGFYDTPIAVAITNPTPGTAIHYTTDGSTPSETHGSVYSSPINIDTTTALRAMAFKADFAPSIIGTHSYLFLNDVAVQGSPSGYPDIWGSVAADYAMDPDPADYSRAAGDSNFTLVQARAAIVESLKAIPTISIVTDQENLFDPVTGIYLNPSGRGELWERPVSVEIIGEDGIGHYQTGAGLRIMGFTSRNLGITPKLNMRLLFKGEYGDTKMQYPILGADGPGKFNTIALRGNIRDAWLAEASGFGSATYIGDEWAKRAQFDMNQPAVRGMFAHVYLNGIYWGLYNPTERPDDDFAETYLGGDRTEYDVVKFCCPDRAIAGSTAIWDDLLNEARASLGTDNAYQRIQGNNPDGSPNPSFPVLIDVDSFIDYLINGHYHAQQDWPGNYYVIRDLIVGRTEGFKFFTWDNDIPFAGGNPNSGNKVQTGTGGWWTDSPGEIDLPIRANDEYRLRFADRVYKHYFHGGAMTEANNIVRWNELATHVRPALFAESARWGDAKNSALRTVQDHWDARNANMVNTYFPNRQSVVFSQMRTHDLYPDLDAPEFNRHGGIIPPGFDVYFSAGATTYYTTDGSDPRLIGGTISPTATAAASGTTVTPLLQTGAAVRALVPSDASVDATWFMKDFDDMAWTSGTTGVGYENGTGYEAEISLDLLATMYNVNPSVYLRIPFAGVDPANFQSLILKMKFDDGFIAYLNGVEIASRNPPTSTPVWNSQAGGSPADAQALQFVPIDVTAHLNLLSPTGNVLAIHGLNLGSGSTDFLIVPELQGESVNGGDALTLNSTTHVRARAFNGSEWSALNEATFIVGIPPDASSLVVSELMYHPSIIDAGSEFIEIMNISSADTLDLTGVHFSDGITFAFPLSYTLGPGQRAILVADPAAFVAVHPGDPIAGIYSGGLDNGGERVALSDSMSAEFLAFIYDDKRPWPETPDGIGPSLVLIAPTTAPDHTLAINWRASISNGGNPGGTDRIPYQGGDLRSYAFSDPLEYDFQAMTFTAHRQPGSDDIEIVPQWSTDLENWNEDQFFYLGDDPLTWRVLTDEPVLFLRFKIHLR